jgi:hypothetical protein
MKYDNIDNFTKGWFIGNFDPAILKTEAFEVGFQQHNANDVVEKHYQKQSTEYNLVVSGKLIVNGKHLTQGDIFVYEPNEICDVTFKTDCVIVVVKTPSLGVSDKVVVDD